MKKWQHRWENGESGRHYYRFHNNIKIKLRKDSPNKNLFIIINQLRSGYSKLNAYQNHINPNVLSSDCQTCGVREDTERFFLHCQKYTEQREKILQEIYFITINLFRFRYASPSRINTPRSHFIGCVKLQWGDRQFYFDFIRLYFLYLQLYSILKSFSATYKYKWGFTRETIS